MTAFAHHIPDNGSAFIFYGPHIGVTLEGELGRMYRPRMEAPGNSCGALMLALDRFKNNPSYTPAIRDDDYQQMTLEKVLLPKRDAIVNAENPAKKITEETYEVINNKIHEYVKTCRGEFHAEKVVLLGGIIINTDHGLDDYFDARNFEVIDL